MTSWSFFVANGQFTDITKKPGAAKGFLSDLKDDNATANALIDGEEDVLVTHVVLSETLWILCGKNTQQQCGPVLSRQYRLCMAIA